MSSEGKVTPEKPPPTWTDGMRIKYKKDGKKHGTSSYDRYQKYSRAKSIGEALKLGSKRSDLNWDFARGLFEVVGVVAPKKPDEPSRKRASTISNAEGPPAKTSSAATCLEDGVELGEKGGHKLRRSSMSSEGKVTPEKPVPPTWTDGMRIKYKKDGKKPGTSSYDRYQEYSRAKTIGEALKLGSKRSDLNWDFARGLFEVVGGVVAPKKPDEPARKRAKTISNCGGPPRAVKTPSAATCLEDGVQLGEKGAQGSVLPVAGFGTYKLKKGEAKDPIVEALRAGYRLIDTAQVYENEGDVGAAIRESGIPRENVVLETKVWRSSHGYERTMKAFKQSLKKLGVDYIDLYLIHWPGAKTGWPLPKGTICPPDWTPALRDTGTWKAMEDLYLEGKVKSIGVANYSIRHLKQLMKSCRIKPMVNQVEFHPRLVQSDLLEFCQENGIVLQAYASLGSSDSGQAQNFFAMPPVQAAAKAHGVTPAQVLLRWALDKGALIVPKSCNPKRIQENARVFGFKLTKAQVAAIDAQHDGGRLAWKGLDPDTCE